MAEYRLSLEEYSFLIKPWYHGFEIQRAFNIHDAVEGGDWLKHLSGR
jgi:hypothetical protein